MAVDTKDGRLYAVRVGAHWHEATAVLHGVATVCTGCGERYEYTDVFQTFYSHSDPSDIRQEHKFCECAMEELCEVYEEDIASWSK
jgi:hypothetical protein